MKEEAPNYLINTILKGKQNIGVKNNHIPSEPYNHIPLSEKKSFFPSTLNDWFGLDNSIRNVESILIFTSGLLSFIHPIQSNLCNVFDPK